MIGSFKAFDELKGELLPFRYSTDQSKFIQMEKAHFRGGVSFE